MYRAIECRAVPFVKAENYREFGIDIKLRDAKPRTARIGRSAVQTIVSRVLTQF